jgi:protease-4
MKKKQTQLGVGGRWGVVIVVLMFLGLISFISALVIGLFVSTSDIEMPGNVAHVQVVGPIVANAPTGFMSTDMAGSTEIVMLLEKAGDNPDIKAVLIEINSPGGTAVASYEVAEAVKKLNKTTVAWIREAGASGAYWVASAADQVIANPMSVTGSIGVIGSYIEFGGTLNRYNASYQRLVSGDYKDMGSPFRKLKQAEEDILQSNLDAIRDVFVEGVAENRGLTLESVDAIADGRFYIGKQALELGLIDALGGKQDAIDYIEKTEGITAELTVYKKAKTLAELLAGVFGEQSFLVGQGMGKAVVDTDVNPGVKVFT